MLKHNCTSDTSEKCGHKGEGGQLREEGVDWSFRLTSKVDGFLIRMITLPDFFSGGM